MLFNSYEFIFLFVPITFFIYFLLIRFNFKKYSRIWLVIASLFFYGYWEVKYLYLIIFSIVINYFLGIQIARISSKQTKFFFLIFGIVFNLSFLGYYKYYDFFIENINHIFQLNLPLLKLVLPLGISFFTFQQIAYLVDSYKGETSEYNFFDYSLFVSFFPQLIAGPIVHHKEIMPQFDSEENLKINYKNIAIGLFIFSVGLFKKVIIADTIGQLAEAGYSNPKNLKFIDAWLASLAFTFQIYYDFSGYSEMAVGLGKLFNIDIIWNFDSPFKTNNIQDLWRKWHISLSRFLKDYVYIPLGGSKVSEFRNYFNLIITFTIGGIWHGAGWTFFIWGFLTGIGIVFHKLWRKKFELNNFLAYPINFLYFHLGSVFFRANSLSDAIEILKGMFGLNGFLLPESLKFLNTNLPYQKFGSELLNNLHYDILSYLILGMFIAFFGKNTRELSEQFKPNFLYGFLTFLLFTISVMNLLNISKFLYFNF